MYCRVPTKSASSDFSLRFSAWATPKSEMRTTAAPELSKMFEGLMSL